MHKVLVIARREYLAAVRTKAFLITLLIMPLLMGGSILVQLLLKDAKDTRERHFAVIDRSPGGRLFEAIRAAAEKMDAEVAAGRAPGPGFKVEQATPKDASPEALDDLREQLSGRVRGGSLQGFVEIGPDVYSPAKGPAGSGDAGRSLRFQTNRPTIRDFPELVNRVVTEKIEDERWREAGLDAAKVRGAIQGVPHLESRELSTRNPATGKVEEGRQQNPAAAFLVPFGVMMLMFMGILLSATPLMQGVVEEKMQRIAEVLLGSVRPFDLMLGKLLGMTAVSLTITAVYLGGAWWAAGRYGFKEYFPGELLAWFLAYQALAALMYGSLFAAVGAACTDMKETQTLMWPVMILVIFPMWMLGAVVNEPSGAVVTGMSFFPFATPMLMVARQAVPPGVPWWQPAVGAAGVLLTTLLCVWVAGRIFRVGILLQGKGARVGDLARWVLRG
jgi:ABC-2 type transport system permease protein